MTDTSVRAGTVTVTLDGREIEARPGEMIIAAAERAGTYIPRFCYHPRMKPVGMCRMCLVEVKGPRGFSLQPACFVAVSEGQEVVTTSAKVHKAQDGVLEFLLINHPLDCPVCDKGGECPLQDQALAYGPGESRFIEEKRHWEKPIPISSLVYLDRERCIQCARCTRFAEEWAGDPLIDFYERGDRIEVATFPNEPFSSYFSGNTVQICPVGALTASPYRFKARPWDLEQVETTCTTCSVGCRMVAQSSSNRLTRYLGVDSEPVNWSWLCDKGRFSFESVNSDDRVTEPLLRRDGSLERVSWNEALDAAAEILAGAQRVGGPGGVALLGGARLANEDAYTWARLAKGVIGTDSVDCQLGDGLAAEVVLGLPRATIEDACSASTLVLLGPDVREELPVLYLRLRDAVVNRGLGVVELSPVATSMTEHSLVSLRHRPGESAALAKALVGSEDPVTEVAGVAPEQLMAARRHLGGGDAPGGERAGDGVVVLVGRQSLAEAGSAVGEAAASLASALPGARFLPALRRANVLGALDMGLAPGILPGRVGLAQAGPRYETVWGRVPEARGLDAAGILSAAAERSLGAVILLGADPVSDFTDRGLATRALDAASVVAVDTYLNASSRRADVVLPAAMFSERAGTTTNLEGRITTLGQKLVGPGTAWPEWMIAVELSARLGSELAFSSLEEIWDEIEHLAPSYRGITSSLLSGDSARDGIVAPLAAVKVSIGHGPAARPIDPMATPGIDAVERQGSPSRTGSSQESASINGASDDPRGTTVARPPLLAPVPPGQNVSVPRVDGYSLRLVSGRVLYDQGTLNQSCPSLGPLAPDPHVRVDGHELERLGVPNGERLRVRSRRGSVDLVALADPGVPRGVAVIPFNLGTPGVADLIDAGEPVTDVRLETLDG